MISGYGTPVPIDTGPVHTAEAQGGLHQNGSDLGHHNLALLGVEFIEEIHVGPGGSRSSLISTQRCSVDSGWPGSG
jgi:hypothetical protein